jgi:predicted nuclease of predicted toxin-antitoxin system
VNRFLIDENLPRSLVAGLRAAGIEAVHAVTAGLRGSSDDAVFNFACTHGFVLVSGDVGFSNIFRFRLGTHAGIVVTRFPNDLPVGSLNQAIIEALQALSHETLQGSLAIVEPGRIRLRRSPAQ